MLPHEAPESAGVLASALFAGYILAGLGASKLFLPAGSSRTTRRLYAWLVFDLCIHAVHESIFLYQNLGVYGPAVTDQHAHRAGVGSEPVSASAPNSLSLWGPVSASASASASASTSAAHPRPWLPPNVHIWSNPTRSYGAYQAPPSSLLAGMWSHYGRADRRWAGPDLQVVAVEAMMCVFGTGLATAAIVRIHSDGPGGKVGPRAAVWVAIMAVMELIGYWCLFVPELLTGCPNFDLTKAEYVIVHLGIMNGIWLVFPAWCLRVCYDVLVRGGDGPDRDGNRATDGDEIPPEMFIHSISLPSGQKELHQHCLLKHRDLRADDEGRVETRA